jgi:ribosomal protein S14
MLSMTAFPAPRTAQPVRRLVLVPASGRTDSAVRRFRLARLRLEDREVARAERFAHLKSVHD